MTLHYIRIGFLAGIGFLAALALAEYVITRAGAGDAVTGAGDADVTAQVWQVLAEARKICEEA
jgi:hypothetical protein